MPNPLPRIESLGVRKSEHRVVEGKCEVSEYGCIRTPLLRKWSIMDTISAGTGRGDSLRETDFDEYRHRERDDMGEGLSNVSCSGWYLFVSIIGLRGEARWLLQRGRWPKIKNDVLIL